MNLIHLTAGFLLAAAAASSSFAQDSKSLKDQLTDYTTDLSLPASPAAAHVGLSQENVIMPRNRKAAEAGISKVIGDDGKAVGAIELTPFYMFRGEALEYARYRDDFGYRARTKTSLGLASGKRMIEKAEVSATGYSLSSVLIDLGDPVYSHRLQACINKVQADSLARLVAARDKRLNDEKKKAKDEGKPEPLPKEDDARPFDPADVVADPEASTAYKACTAKREAELWNRTRLSVGLASGSGRETAGQKRRLDFGNSIWLSAQYGFEGLATLRRVLGTGDRYVDCVAAAGDTCTSPHRPDRFEQNAMATFHVRHVRGASDLDLSVTGPLPKYDSTLAAFRFTYGSDKRNVFIETSRSWVKTPADTKRMEQHAFGASFLVREGTWLNLVNGRRKSFVNGTLDNVMELNLQIGYAGESAVPSGRPAAN